MWLLILSFVVISGSSSSSSFQEDYLQQPRSTCYSCANFAYLTIWHKLMHHYFPPKNFTDDCWYPAGTSEKIETVPCSSACFTLVERIDQYDYPSTPEFSGVLRGCVDRLLLFGVDDDIRNVYAANTLTCRQTERKLLRLFPLSSDSPSVTFCSCTGERCNHQEMLVSGGYGYLPLIPTTAAVFLLLL